MLSKIKKILINNKKNTWIVGLILLKIIIVSIIIYIYDCIEWYFRKREIR